MRGTNMGLFSKNPAEKRLKELTGGIFLTNSFKDKLTKAGLTSADGYKIQNEIKDNIKKGKIKEESIETRINYLIKKMSTTNKSKINTSDNASQTEFRLLTYIDGCSIDNDLKNRLKNDVKNGKIKEISTLINKINAEKKLSNNIEKPESEDSTKTIGKNPQHIKDNRTKNNVKTSNYNKSERNASKKIKEGYDKEIHILN